MTSGEYIQSFREQHNMSRNQLAYYTGCSANLVARLENGAEPSSEWWDAFQNVYTTFDEDSAYAEESEEIRNEMEYMLEGKTQVLPTDNAGQPQKMSSLEDNPAERVHAARERYGLTCSALAELLGVSRSRVSQMEHGKVSAAQADEIIERIEKSMSN